MDQNSPSPASPYTNWITAATIIQDAIDVSSAGDEIIVTNGIYQSGGRVVYGSSMNRIAATIPIAIRSVNGPGVTTIQGYQVPGTTNGDGAVRGAYLTNAASLSGFTITGGATRAAGDPIEQFGGGVLCESWDANISNCVITANTSTFAGGGAYFGTFWDCIVTSNTSSAVYAGILHNCVLEGNTTVGSGGAAGDSTLYNCIVRSNSASSYGGGVDYCHLYHCDLIGNRSTSQGGGAFNSYLVNCIVRSNSATSVGGGTSSCNLYNCTVVGNSGFRVSGTSGGFLYNSIVYYNAGAKLS